MEQAAFLSSSRSFIEGELRNQFVEPRQLSSLELEKVFPSEIITVVQRDTSVAFLGMWHNVERAVQGKI